MDFDPTYGQVETVDTELKTVQVVSAAMQGREFRRRKSWNGIAYLREPTLRTFDLNYVRSKSILRWHLTLKWTSDQEA